MLFISQRYLLSKRSRSVINIIAGVSLISVATPVAAVIILLSIFNGFSSFVGEMNEAVDADLTISPTRGRYFATSEVDTLRIKSLDGVEAISQLCDQTLLFKYNDRETIATLRGVDREFSSVVPIADYVSRGEFHLYFGDLNRLVMGAGMAARLGVYSLVDADITLYAMHSSTLLPFAPAVDFISERAKLSGVYMLDAQSEERYVYAPLRLSNILLGVEEDRISDILIKVLEGYRVEDVQSKIKSIVGDDFTVLRRQERNSVLYDIIKYEKWGIIFISIMVMILASLSLIGVAAMLITDKRADMITLRALGASTSALRQIFFLQGMLISLIGVAIGVVVGVGVTLVQWHYGVLKLPTAAFVMESYPVDLQIIDLLGIVSVVILISATLNYIVTHRMIK